MHRIRRLPVHRVSDSRIDSPYAVRDDLCRRTYPLNSIPPVQHGGIPLGCRWYQSTQVNPGAKLGRKEWGSNPRPRVGST